MGKKAKLPSFITKELKKKRETTSDKVLFILKNEPYHIDSILIALWTDYKIKTTRANLTTMLSRMVRDGRLTTKPYSGLYQPKQSTGAKKK